MAKLQRWSALAGASLLASLLFGAPAWAQDATWLAAPGSADFNTSANWTPATVPTGTAFFGTSNTTSLTFSNASTSLGGFTFNAGAPAYTFTTAGGQTLTFTSAGIVNGGLANFTNGGTINFDNLATAGNAAFTTNSLLNFNNTSTAGSAVIFNNHDLTFNGTSTAGTSFLGNDGSLTFNDNSTAGSSTIVSNGNLAFNNNSTAASANISNTGGLAFNNNSTAGSATIANSGGIQFNGASTAGNAVITNTGAIFFTNNSTAGNATITGAGSSVVEFRDASTAGSATITNNFEVSFIGSSTAGSTTIANTFQVAFGQSSTAGNATIKNNSFVDFSETASAGSATITNGNRGSIGFGSSSTAGNATITNNNNSSTNFDGTSTAGSATITNNAGGSTRFFGSADGGNARLINSASGGTFDFSASTGPLGNGQINAGSIEGGGLFVLGTNELIVGGNNLSTTVSGVISGNGPVALDKVGTGTLTLTGFNAYTGATTIDGGVLDVNGSIALSSLTSVNSGAVLTGVGVVGTTQVNGGGLIAPGGPSGAIGTLAVSGNLAFASGALYLVQVSGASASQIAVTGTAALGGNVEIDVTSRLTRKTTYTILTSGGLNNTAFSAANLLIANNFARDPVLTYSGGNVFLTLDPGLLSPLLPGNAGANQVRVAGAIDNGLLAGNNLTAAFSAIFNLSGNALLNGLTQLSGETAVGSQQTTFNAMSQFMGLLTDPFMNRGGGFGGSPLSSGYAEEASAYAASGNKNTDAFAMFTKAPSIAPSFEQRWSVWAAGFGGSQSTSGNVALGSNNTTSNIAGTAVGADYLFSPNTIAGFALAGGGTNFSVANGGSGRSDLFQIGAYVRHTNGPAYISASLAYGWQDVTTNRTVTVAGIDQLRAQFNANAFSGRLEGGYRYVAPVFGGVGVTPYAAAQFVTFDLPAYAEQAIVGTNTFAQAFGAHDATDVRTELGIRTDKSFAQGDGILTLRGRFAWAHDYDPDRAIGATFQALPGASFVVNGAAQAADSALTTASIEKRWRNGWSAAATFEGEFSNVTQSYAGKGVVRYQW